MQAPTNFDAKTRSLPHLVQSPTTQASRTVRPTEKSKYLKKTPPTPLPAENLQALVTQLTNLLNLDWNVPQTDDTSAVAEEDPIRILASRLHSEANAPNESHFVCSTQHDVEEPESYIRAMQCPYAA